MNKKEKKFDAVKWVREIRDKFYEEHKHLSMEEYLAAHKMEAEKFKSIKKTTTNKPAVKSNRKKIRKTKVVS